MSQSTIFTKVQYAGQVTDLATEGTSYNELARCQSFTHQSNNNIIYDRGLGEGLNAVNSYWGVYDVTGSTSFNIVDFDILKHWIGPKSGSGTAGTPYVLTEATKIDFNTSNLQPFSFERLNDNESTDSVDVFIGCVGTDFTISGDIGAKIVCNTNWIARHDFQRTTHQAYTPVTESAFISINGTWKWGSTPSTLSGIRNFRVSYNNGLVTDTRSLESRFIQTPKLGQRVYNFELTIIMAQALQSTIYTNFYGGALTPADGSTSINPTSNLEFKIELVNGSKYANIWLDNCSIDTLSKPTNLGDGLVLVTISGTGWNGKSNTPISWWSV